MLLLTAMVSQEGQMQKLKKCYQDNQVEHIFVCNNCHAYLSVCGTAFCNGMSNMRADITFGSSRNVI